MNRKSLFDKIEELIEKHIEEIVDKKIASQKQSLEKFIEREINNKNKNSTRKQIISKKQPKVEQRKKVVKNERMFKDVFGFTCPISEANQDHVMPKDSNGSGVKSNLMWMCRASNRSKSHEIEGEINGIKYKINPDHNFDLKSGKSVGTLSVFDKNKNLYVQKSTRKENNRFMKIKDSPIEK